jgi:hypothetical protein
MKPLLVLAIYILSSMEVYGQENPLKNYYVVDSVVYKNRVKIKFDTLSNPPKQNTITEYDSLGREILFYYTDRNFKYKSVYKTSADTILCFLSMVSGENQDEKVIEIHKYLYNDKREIILKSNCYNNSNDISAELTRFYYDSLDRLTAKHFYYLHNFSKELNEHYSTNESFYKLNTAENYFYDKKGMLALIKEITGPKEERFTDTLKYDKYGKLKTIARFQKYGSMGELRQENIHYTTNYFYTDSSWRKYESVSFGDNLGEDKSDWRNPTIEYVFSKSGLLVKEYMVYDNHKELYRRYDYVYFE